MRALVERIQELACASTECRDCRELGLLAREALSPPPEFDEA